MAWLFIFILCLGKNGALTVKMMKDYFAFFSNFARRTYITRCLPVEKFVFFIPLSDI